MHEFLAARTPHVLVLPRQMPKQLTQHWAARSSCALEAVQLRSGFKIQGLESRLELCLLGEDAFGSQRGLAETGMHFLPESPDTSVLDGGRTWGPRTQWI